jgi:hypothetical protein
MMPGGRRATKYNASARMKLVVSVAIFLVVAAVSPAHAQDPPPRIPLFVIDAHGVLPKFPKDEQLSASRGLQLGDLPGAGLGVDLAAHLNFFKWRAITFGIGGEAMTSRSKTESPSPATLGRVVTEKFRTLNSQLSFNFGTGHGWSYISGGIGRSIWSLIAEGQPTLAVDEEPLKTINYGGGARWFAKTHLAFSFDVRFHAINPGTASAGYPPSPRTTLLVIGAGVSVK